VTDYGTSSGRKRGELEEDRNCTGSVKPDTLMLADGTKKYNIVDLDYAKVKELALLHFILASICWLEPLTDWSFHFSLLLLSLEVGPEEFPEEFRALRK